MSTIPRCLGSGSPPADGAIHQGGRGLCTLHYFTRLYVLRADGTLPKHSGNITAGIDFVGLAAPMDAPYRATGGHLTPVMADNTLYVWHRGGWRLPG